jgi:Sulfotransferase family
MNNHPLFILAPPRSFTSVICGMIGQHPAMYGLPEVNLFAGDDYEDLGRLYRLRPGFRHGLLRAVAELGLGEQTEENINVAMKWLEENKNVSGGMIYRDLVEWGSPRRLVDKSPIYVYSPESLQRIKQAFPSASYIHLVRHPRATCESIYKLRNVVKEGLDKMRVGEAARKLVKDRYERLAQVEDPDDLWLKPHLRIIEFLEGIDDSQHTRINGEDFMSDPDSHLARIAEWLGISTDKESIEAMRHPERSPYACYGPQNAKYGNDPSYLEKPELREYKPRVYILKSSSDDDVSIDFSDDLIQHAMHFGYT